MFSAKWLSSGYVVLHFNELEYWFFPWIVAFTGSTLTNPLYSSNLEIMSHIGTLSWSVSEVSSIVVYFGVVITRIVRAWWNCNFNDPLHEPSTQLYKEVSWWAIKTRIGIEACTSQLPRWPLSNAKMYPQPDRRFLGVMRGLGWGGGRRINCVTSFVSCMRVPCKNRMRFSVLSMNMFHNCLRTNMIWILNNKQHVM